jgi:hypothetical protein
MINTCAELVQRDRIDISPDIVWQAGLSIARKLYQIYATEGTRSLLLGEVPEGRNILPKWSEPMCV